MSDRWERVGRLFEQALAVPASERERFIAAAGEPDDVKDETRSLLASHDTADGFLYGLPTLDADDPQEASRTEQAYRRFAPQRLPIDDVLRRDRNVVELWEFAPTIDHLNTLNGCLKS